MWKVRAPKPLKAPTATSTGARHAGGGIMCLTTRHIGVRNRAGRFFCIWGNGLKFQLSLKKDEVGIGSRPGVLDIRACEEVGVACLEGEP